MNVSLENSIRKAYPSGIVYELDEAALENEERDARIQSVLDSCAIECRLNWSFDVFKKPAYTIWLTQEEHPAFYDWVWRMDSPEKIAWIKQNSEPYPVLWLRISRVADYYYHFYNHWTVRGDTGYLNADCARRPNDTWSAYQSILERQLHIAGFEYLGEDVCGARTPFVLEHDYVPEDDPRLDDIDFEPPLVPTTVHECLFSH